MRSRAGTHRRKAVLFVTHEHSTGHASYRYRSLYQAEALASMGVTCDVTRHGDPDLPGLVEGYECVVLHRFPRKAAAPIIRRARRLGRMVVSNTDDLVFDADVTADIEAIVDMSHDWRASWAESYQATIGACDGAIVATAPLAEQVGRHARPVATLPNVAGEDLVRLSEQARRGRAASRDGEDVAVAYLSGSLTHRRDFEQASAALLRVLEARPRARFVAVGPLDLDPRFDGLGMQVERIPRRPWDALPGLLAQIDVNLAPLADNPFSESKSCVKYLEAALVGVPTVASPRADFARVIEHGRNGLLAASEDEWVEAISSLVDGEDRRRALGEAAYADVHARHTTRVGGTVLAEAWATLTAARTDPAQPLTVDWLVADGGSPARGLETIEALAERLAARGHASRLLADGEPTTPADVRIATDTTTAYALAEHDDALVRIRLVLDSAQTGFELPLRHVCLDEGLAGRVHAASGRAVDVLPPGAQAAGELEALLLRACSLRLTARPAHRRVDWGGLASRLGRSRLPDRRAD